MVMMVTNGIVRSWVAGVLVALLTVSPLAGEQNAANQITTIKVQTNIVLTNVVVRDKKTGEMGKGVKPNDLTVLENNKPEKIASLDYENVDQAAVLNEKTTTVSGKATVAQL